MDDPSQPQCVLFHKSKSDDERRAKAAESAPVYNDFHQSVSIIRAKFHKIALDNRLVSPQFPGSSLTYRLSNVNK